MKKSHHFMLIHYIELLAELYLTITDLTYFIKFFFIIKKNIYFHYSGLVALLCNV